MANGTREGRAGDSSPLRAHVPRAHTDNPGSQLLPAAQGHGLCVWTWEWVSFPAFSQSETSRAGCLRVKPGLNIIGTAARPSVQYGLVGVLRPSSVSLGVSVFEAEAKT